MICNICANEKKTHEYEDLDVCEECQILIDKEIKKPKVEDNT